MSTAMKKTTLSLLIGLTLSASGNLLAASVEERLAAMEQRLQQLEKKIESQEKVIAQKDEQIENLTNSSSSSAGWFQSVELTGLVEVEASKQHSAAADTSDIAVATVELGIAAKINDWTDAEVVLLYEDGGNLDVDTATISIADPDNIWTFTAGKTVAPFGVYDTNLVSDPLTLQMSETPEDILMFGIDKNGFSTGAYIFNGDIDKGGDEVKSAGAYLGYAYEHDDYAIAATLGYINNFADSDGISGLATQSITQHIGGWAAAFNMTSGSFNLIGEYVGATDDFAANTLATTSAAASPSAWNIEAAYNFSIQSIPSTIAIGFQGTDEATDIGLPENKTLLALSMMIMENTSLSFEFANEEDYAGADTDTLTGVLAVDF
jgi:hypothetical protein